MKIWEVLGRAEEHHGCQAGRSGVGLNALRKTQLRGHARAAGISEPRHEHCEVPSRQERLYLRPSLAQWLYNIALNAAEQMSAYSRAMANLSQRPERPEKVSQKADRSRKYVTQQVTRNTQAAHFNSVSLTISLYHDTSESEAPHEHGEAGVLKSISLCTVAAQRRVIDFEHMVVFPSCWRSSP